MLRVSEHLKLSNASLFTRGGRLGVRSAFFGSIAFALVETISIFVNTYWIKQIDARIDAQSIIFSIGWIVVLVVVGSLLAFLPAFLLGGLLAVLVDLHNLSKAFAVMMGVMFGIFASTIIWAPIKLFQFDFTQTTGHGDFSVFLVRAMEAILIAALAGGWIGRELAKYLN
jgi:hypothetical protein